MKTDYLILILGGNTMQLPAIRIAKRKGWRVIVADRNADAPGIPLADYFARVDLKDQAGMLELATEYNRLYHLDGVFTAGTDFSTTVAFVAEKLQLPGIPYEVARAASDKALMREVFKKHGIPCPGFLKITREQDLASAAEKLRFPLVIKPVDNMGARGVRRIDHPGQLKPAFAAASAASRTASVILEEFIAGPEFSLDAVVYRGEVFLCGVADRHIHFPPYFVELGHTIPTNTTPENLAPLLDVFQAGIKALGITNGAAKGDLFMSQTGPFIGEIAARLSGGYMSGWTYPYASGIEPTAAALNIAVGLAPDDLTPLVKLHSAERAFISIPGIIKEIRQPVNEPVPEGLMDIFCLVKPGDNVVFPRNNVEKCGNFISRADTRKKAIAIAETAVKNIALLLQPHNQATEDFLFKQQEKTENIHRAFTLQHPGNIRALAEMPAYCGKITAATTFRIIPLPALELESATDWHGMSLPETLACICRLWGADPFHEAAAANSFQIGKIFWQAVCRGGYQGGLYCLATIHALFADKNQLTGRLSLWAAQL